MTLVWYNLDAGTYLVEVVCFGTWEMCVRGKKNVNAAGIEGVFNKWRFFETRGCDEDGGAETMRISLNCRVMASRVNSERPVCYNKWKPVSRGRDDSGGGKYSEGLTRRCSG